MDNSNSEPMEAASPEPNTAGPLNRRQKIYSWYRHHLKISLPLSLLVILLALFSLPASRYALAGTVIKNNFSLKLVDAAAHIPVSGAVVKVGTVTGTTNADGLVSLPGVAAGQHTFSLSKTYYQSRQVKLTVPILSQKQTPNLDLTATGRPVEVSVINLINHQPVKAAEVDVDGSKSVTDASGKTLVVVPAGTTTHQAKISAAGFNDSQATIEDSAQQIKDNQIKLTPSGQVYFLSKLSGKIDVVKTNLDGSARQTVLAGTGKEDDQTTILLASRDWSYLALLANRDGATKLYIINTKDDNLLTVDQTNADFTAIGWQDHYFVYTVGRHNYNDWQANAFSIKSYNAETGKMLTLANTNASGNSLADAQYENFWEIKLVGRDIVFSRTWYKYPGYLDVGGRQDTLAAIDVDGTNSRTLKSVDAADFYITNLRVSAPRVLEFTVASNRSSDATFFMLDNTGKINQVSQFKDDSQPLLTYLQSPSGDQTFWREQRDGKNSLLVGDKNGANAKTVASLSAYTAYGWYSDDYLLVSKNASELYIMSVSGIGDDSQAVKLADYHKPALDFYGYGGGYGGL